MPAAAVIPAPIAYIKVVAVETLVVGCFCARGDRGFSCKPAAKRVLRARSCSVAHLPFPDCFARAICLGRVGRGAITLKKLECSKQAVLLE